MWPGHNLLRKLVLMALKAFVASFLLAQMLYLGSSRVLGRFSLLEYLTPR